MNEEGAPGPARIDGLSSSPFGALVYWTEEGKVAMCNATHILPGRILTASHCLHGTSNLESYRAIFYDRTRTLRGAKVVAVPFAGDSVVDAAVLDLDTADSAGWEVLGGTIRTYDARSIASKVPDREAVMIWSYTPIASDSKIKDRYTNSIGMVFRPNRCWASRTVPHLDAYIPSKSKEPPKKIYEYYFKKQGVVDERFHLFLDQCSYPVVHGNSGSLISSLSVPGHKIGVLHLFVADKDKIWGEIEKRNSSKNVLEYTYTGNDNIARPFAWGFGEFTIASGTALEALGEKLSLLKAGPR